MRRNDLNLEKYGICMRKMIYTTKINEGLKTDGTRDCYQM
jgi:hypothetical protein